jgi:hypothetical protein
MLQLFQKHRGDDDLIFAIPISLSLMSEKIDAEISSMDVAAPGNGGAPAMSIFSMRTEFWQRSTCWKSIRKMPWPIFISDLPSPP